MAQASGSPVHLSAGLVMVANASSRLAALWLLLAPFAALAGERVKIPLTVEGVPTDVWNKNRIAAGLVDGALRLSDRGEGPFDDASFWRLRFGTELPRGRKHLSFRVEVAEGHEPLWGSSLLQPIVDGREAAPALDEEGQPSFERIVAADGKSFVPVPPEGGAATITLRIPSTARRLDTFAFMTAGATGFDITLSDFHVVAWPEADDRVVPQNPVATSLGFAPGHPQSVAVEWTGYDPDATDAPREATVTLSGPDGTRDIEVALPRTRSLASASPVSRLDLDLAPGRYALAVPALGEGSRAASVEFEVMGDTSGLVRMRDEAWGAFHWITSGPTGPYPQAHLRDAKAQVFGSAETRDVSGGWYDAGDYGKYVVNGSWSVALMLLTGLHAPDALDHPIEPLAGPSGVPDWIDVAVAELDWLARMQGPDGGVYHKATTRDWPSLDAAPRDDAATRYLMPVSSTATAGFAAAMSLGAKVLTPHDAERAARFERAAGRALAWLDAHSDLVMTERLYDGREYGGAYMDRDDADERFFAHAAWAALKRTKQAVARAERLIPKRRRALDASGNDTSWNETDLLGMWALKSVDDALSPDARTEVHEALRAAAREWRVLQRGSPWLLPMRDDQGFPWGSNGMLATIGWHWLLWARADGDDGFAEAAEALLPYFHGRNPLGQTYVTNAKGARDPHLRPVVSGAIELPPGFLVGGPNSIDLAGDPAGGAILGRAPLRMYVDRRESFATNEVAINWQAAWALYASLLVAASR